MEKKFAELIECFKREATTNNFNFTEGTKKRTIDLLHALKCFHSEEGTTPEQDQLLREAGLQWFYDYSEIKP